MNLVLLLPELTLLVTAVVVILLDLFLTGKGALVAVSLIGLALAAYFSLNLWGGTQQPLLNNLLALDNFALFFKLIFLTVAFLVILATQDYVARLSRFQGEFYALLLLSTLGMMLMAATAELISIYLALELTSISLYALVGFLKDKKSTEASLKYLLLGAIASGVLLYGMALIFGFTGTTHLGDIARTLRTMALADLMASPALLLGTVMLIGGFGFKIAAVPFQMWVPDVYEGAPTPVTAFLSVASKAAGFAVILRVFSTALGTPSWLTANWGIIFAWLAIISMTAGNLAAIPQNNIKRLFGYSSIAQAGYLMVGLAAMGFSAPNVTAGQSGIMFFLASYALTNIGAFTAIIAITNQAGTDEIGDFAGMMKRSPLLALALTLCLISLIGMPPAAGFMGKFFIFSAAVQEGLLWLVVVAVINSVISAYYYLRVVKVMWFGTPPSADEVPSSTFLRAGLLISCAGVLLLGVFPGGIMALAQVASRMLPF
ncbi:MAG: NADH-quinone oxidoreductase subunit N [Chloroflexota bacterium]